LIQRLREEECHEDRIDDSALDPGWRFARLRLGGPYEAYIRIPKFMRLNQQMPESHRISSMPSTAGLGRRWKTSLTGGSTIW